jgi:two-component sensor histidine kinase
LILLIFLLFLIFYGRIMGGESRHPMDHRAAPPANPDLVAEANHRVANSLALLGSLVRLQAKAAGRAKYPYSNAEVRMMFDGIAARIATVGHIHRLLAHVPSEGTLALNAHLREICSALITAFSSDQQQVHIDYHGTDCLVLTKYVQPLTLIVCEILTNAMKYAHPAGVPVRMAVNCEAHENGTLVISVGDDGIGLPEGFDPSTDGSIGFQVVRALAVEMGAGLVIQSDNLGVTFTLTVPSALVANARTA